MLMDPFASLSPVAADLVTKRDDRNLRKRTPGEPFISISRELKPSTSAWGGVSKIIGVSGSSLINLNNLTGFVSNTAARRNKLSILAFEVANTIVKGSNLMQSLSKENIQILKKEILHSEGVQLLVSVDMKKLLNIAAADKRNCITSVKLWNKLEQYYQRRLEDVESLHLPRKGESLTALKSELKHQRKLVRNLQKKSLWSISLHEVVEKLVDVVIFIHQAISEAFEENGIATWLKKHAAYFILNVFKTH